jgi:tetratricopeptide (TPR) repeat protein
MKLEQIDWNQDVPETYQEKYQALVPSLRRRKGFGLLFVECSPAQGEKIIENVKADLPQEKIEVWHLDQPIEKLFNLVEDLQKTKPVDILFVQGLEHSFYEYENNQRKMGWDRDKIYTQSWGGVPEILNHLNQQRERFRDRFNICFVFLLPRFTVDYFIRRAPDFFDWRSGFFKFPMDAETLRQESQKVCWERWQKEDYLALTPQERRQKIVEIQSLIDEDGQTPDQKADLFFEKGLLHRKAGELEAAIESYDQAIEIKPYLHQAWNNRGNVLGNLGRYEDAIASYDRAIEIKPDFHEAWNNRGNVLGNLGRYEDAIASFNKAIEIKPDDREAWYGKACCYALQGNVEQAIENLQQAIELNPEESREMAKTDSDFDNIREDERFQALIQG